MIEGINPATISRITYGRGRRRGGPRRDWRWLKIKQNWLNAIVIGDPDWAYWSAPRVWIEGANGSVIKWIEYPSNDAMFEAHARLNKQLEDWVDGLSNPCKFSVDKSE